MVFAAEVGDKSQLLVLALSARYRPWSVFAGLSIATAVVNGAMVLLGGGMGVVLPARPLAVAAGLVFLAFAAWILREEPAGTETIRPPARGLRSPVTTTAVAFTLAELGDKTMLATVTLAANLGVVGTWAGATSGMITAGGVAIVVGRQLSARLPERTVKRAAAAGFAVVGLVLLAGAIHG